MTQAERGDRELLGLVWHAGRRWDLPLGGSLTVGRAALVDIRIAHDPEDDYVSRRAATLVALDDTVLVRNESRGQPLVFRPVVGRERVIEPQSAMAALNMDFFRVLVPGRHRTTHVISVTVPGLRSGPDDAVDPGALRGGRRTVGASAISGREMRALAALCEPLLSRSGSRRPAGYDQIAARLGTSRDAVRNTLDGLRFRLATEDGIPDLQRAPDEPEGPAQVPYLVELAAWAERSRTITPDVLDQLLPPDA